MYFPLNTTFNDEKSASRKTKKIVTAQLLFFRLKNRREVSYFE